MSEKASVIKVEGLVKKYRGRRSPALDEVNLEIFEGEIFGLIGPNGAGKTTLMGCLLSILRPSSGTISIFGHAAADLEVKKQLAFLPERPNFDAWMSAWQFMNYQHMLALRPRASAREEIEQALQMVELDPSAWHRRIKKFSRGMLQRLGLAQMLLGKPRLCFLDEPGSGMDPLGANLLRKLLLKWKEDNVTVVLNSHHLDEVERVCDRVAFIKNGKIEQCQNLAEQDSQANELILLVRLDSECQEESLIDTSACMKTTGAELLSSENNLLRFRLSEKSDKVKLIRFLVQNNLPVEEAFQEKRGLEELFLSFEKESQ